MTLDQALAFAIVAAMMGLFVWGRLRYDLVAMLALLAAVARRHRAGRQGLHRLQRRHRHHRRRAPCWSAPRWPIRRRRDGAAAGSRRICAPTQPRSPVLVGVGDGAVGLRQEHRRARDMMPVAFQMARRTGTPPSRLLMPMAFGSLLGGLVTLVGTSPNIIVSRVREEMLGEPFSMFDFTPVGLGHRASAGLVFLAFGYRLLPRGPQGRRTIDAALDIEDYITEARVPAGLARWSARRSASSQALAEDEVDGHRHHPRTVPPLQPRPARDAARGRLLHPGGRAGGAGEHRRPRRARLWRRGREPEARRRTRSASSRRWSTAELAADRQHRRRSSTLHARSASTWWRSAAAASASPSGCAPSAPAPATSSCCRAIRAPARYAGASSAACRWPSAAIRLGRARRRCCRSLVLGRRDGAGGAAAGAGGRSPSSAPRVLLLLFASLTLREAYETVEWPILMLLGALIPVSEAIRTTGGTDLIAGWLVRSRRTRCRRSGALALIMVVAMAVTPFLNNAATVLVMAPIAASFAQQLGLRPDAVPDGGGDRRGLRFPHADRPPVQHAGDGAGRLPLRRLLAAGPAAVGASSCWSGVPLVALGLAARSRLAAAGMAGNWTFLRGRLLSCRDRQQFRVTGRRAGHIAEARAGTAKIGRRGPCAYSAIEHSGAPHGGWRHSWFCPYWVPRAVRLPTTGFPTHWHRSICRAARDPAVAARKRREGLPGLAAARESGGDRRLQPPRVADARHRARGRGPGRVLVGLAGRG